MTAQFFYSLINPAIAGVLSAAFAALWLFKPGEGYLALLAGSFLLCGFGFAANDFLLFLEGPALRLVVNGAFFAAVLGVCISALDRVRAPVPGLGYAAICAFAALVFCWFLFVQPSVEARVHTMHLGLASLAALTVRQLLIARPTSLLDRFFVALGAFSVVLAAVRSVAVLVRGLDTSPDATARVSPYWATVQAITPAVAIAVAIIFMVALAARLIGELRMQADRDYLTGLLNRGGFDKRVLAVLDAETAYETAAALLVLDIDDFKRINDSFGHAVGDEVITAVGGVLQRHGRTDLVARSGGEEYALFYPQANRSELAEIADDIRIGLRSMRIPSLPSSHAVTASIGIHLRRQAETLRDMKIQADKALYQVKARGKDAALIASCERTTVPIG
ncbi:GGDEF domain-containing protein [Devosia albogilva]|uniref:diguanylate cyclase n=1 Tax=Devosia albogilva TaxID=429726 RepID=A0ABW5QM16_9HYPH